MYSGQKEFAPIAGAEAVYSADTPATGEVVTAAANYEISKRALDTLLATLAVIGLVPLFGTIYVALLLIEGRPVFYRHRRIGKNGQEFECLKFRTMVRDAQEQLEALLRSDPEARAEWERSHKLANDPRISCLGRFLRKSSLDELPQLFNVLAGSMSLVGPRPICDHELSDYGKAIDVYTQMKPGITGSWQVHGRSSTTFDERVAMDTKYYSERSLLADFRILLKTIPVVFSAKGAS